MGQQNGAQKQSRWHNVGYPERLLASVRTADSTGEGML